MGHERAGPLAAGEGDDVRDFELLDQAGQPWQLSEAIGCGAVVLVFYRGDW